MHVLPFIIHLGGETRMTNQERTLDVLRELIGVCKDGEIGYTHAAGIVTDPKLKYYFQEQRLERARLVQHLRQEAKDLGEKPDTSGSVAGTLHRLRLEATPHRGL